MPQPVEFNFFEDEDGRPAGGHVSAPGVTIDLALPDDDSWGATAEMLISVAIKRLKYLQKVSDESHWSQNRSDAISMLDDSLRVLAAPETGIGDQMYVRYPSVNSAAMIDN